MSNLVLLVPLVLLALFLVYFSLNVRREERRTATTLDRVTTNPNSVTEVRLHNNDPITVEVCFAGKVIPLSGIHGVQAVRTFDDLKTLLPGARFTVFLNGRESPLNG